MTLSPNTERIALQVIAKYLRKGNMARCLRDILPSAHLPREDRRQIADLMHEIVRWKKLYGFLMEEQGIPLSPERYYITAMSRAQEQAAVLPPEYRYSCSPYVAKLFEQQHERAAYLNSNPPTTICVNQNITTRDQVLTRLQDEQIPIEKGHLSTAVLSQSSDLKNSPVVLEKLAHVQDENSQLVAQIAAELGEHILDFCAGNGGKTLALASLSKNTKDLVAYETDERRLETLQRRCQEYHAKATIGPLPAESSCDVVLVDAPCTGLGAARRNPEAKYIEDTDDYPQIQLSILHHAAKFIKPEGFLLYVVCTITPEETSDVISTFTSKAPFDTISVSTPSASFLERTPQGFFTAIPQGDLFFLSVLQRKAN